MVKSFWQKQLKVVELQEATVENDIPQKYIFDSFFISFII